MDTAGKFDFSHFSWPRHPWTCLFDQIQGCWRNLSINLKIMKNMEIWNLKIKLSRVVWSVSLPRPHSRGHTKTTRINDSFVFQDFKFPYVSLFLNLLTNSFNILGFGQINMFMSGGTMKNEVYVFSRQCPSRVALKLATAEIWASTDHYWWSHLQKKIHTE